MTGLSQRGAAFVWRYRYLLVLAVLALSAVSGYAASGLSVSNSLRDWYPEEDPALAAYRDFIATYGDDEVIIVAVHGAKRFDSDAGMEVVAGLTDALLDLEGVAAVTSLVTVPASLAEARGRLLSDDRRTTALIVQRFAGDEADAGRARLLAEIRAAVTRFGLQGYLGGYGVIFDGLNSASTTDAGSLIVISHLVMIALLVLMLRRWPAVMVTLAAIACASVWTMGLYTINGHRLNMVTTVLPTLVLVTAIANCLHFLRAVAIEDGGPDRGTRVVNGIASVIGPCFLMSVTTAAGFLGLAASGLPVVRQLGLFGAAGVMAGFFSSLILVTAALSSSRFEPSIVASAPERVADRLYRLGSGNPRLAIVIFLALAAASAGGIYELESDTESIAYLDDSHVVRRDSDFIESKLGPYAPVEFVVRGEGPVFSAEILDAVWRWQESAVRIENVGWSWSLLNALGLESDDMPSAIGIERLARRLERQRSFAPAAINSMIDGDSELRISFGAPAMSANALRALIDRIMAAAELPSGVSVGAAGYSPLYTRIVSRIVDSQVRGIGLAICLVVILVGIAMRCWRRTLLAVPANAMPVVLTLGLMGYAGIPLDVATATIASVILGLVVDDSVHLLRRHPGRDLRSSMDIASARAGGTLLMTTVVIASGFLLLGLAEIRSVSWFGLLAGFAVLAAVVGDLVLLPALARVSECGLRSGTARTGQITC